MGLIHDKKTGSNISVASINGYTVEKVKRAESYIKEIGGQQRTFPIARLVEMYNDIKGTKEPVPHCRCQFSKFYMGLQNYITYGKLTLKNNGIDVDAPTNEEVKETIEEEPKVDEVELKKQALRERMAKAREAKKKKTEENEKD